MGETQLKRMPCIKWDPSCLFRNCTLVVRCLARDLFQSHQDSAGWQAVGLSTRVLPITQPPPRPQYPNGQLRTPLRSPTRPQLTTATLLVISDMQYTQTAHILCILVLSGLERPSKHWAIHLAQSNDRRIMTGGGNRNFLTSNTFRTAQLNSFWDSSYSGLNATAHTTPRHLAPWQTGAWRS